MTGTRKISAHVYVLRDGVRCTELKCLEAPEIRANADAAIKMTLTGEFACADGVDWVNDKLQPVLTLDDVDYPLGVYCVGTATRKYTATGAADSVEAYDQCLLLQQTCIETRLHLDAGTPYSDAIIRLIARSGIAAVQMDACGEVLATDREDWEAGTDCLTIINALLAEINFATVWIDFNGAAQLRHRHTVSADSVTRTYAAGEHSVLLADGRRALDAYNAPNVFIVSVENPDYAAPMLAVAVNENPDSALSTVRRGRRIVSYTRLNNIASRDALNAYAAGLCLDGMFATEEITFATQINASHQIGEIVALYSNNVSGIYAETAWTMRLEPGAEMLHKARRVMYG